MGPSLSSALQPGQTFGRYQIARTLGVGSFGVVYEAVQYPMGRRVALKLLHDRTLTHPDALARFEREAMAAARLHHPHVVEVFDFGAHEGTAFLAMEILEGESLQALMRRSGPLPQALAVDLMLPMVAAVAAVHDQGIVHRDLKPENVLLTVTPERQWHPKLLDFGIAKLDHAGPELTRTNALLGTPCYMAPEQVMQARSLDGRADQWSLGVMLYEAITGAKPFYSETLLVLMTAITSEDPVPPRVHRSDLDAGFEAVLMRTLQRRPDDRYPTMRDLGSALLPYASEAAQARWYAEFNETPSRVDPRGAQPPAASGPFAPAPAAVPSFAVVEEDATHARMEGVVVDEPTELVNTTSQDAEFPVGYAANAMRGPTVVSHAPPIVSQSLAGHVQHAMQSQPAAAAGPDLFAADNAREVVTGTLAMDLDSVPGAPPSMAPPRPPTAKVPVFKATMEMSAPVVPVVAPAPPMGQAAPYGQPYGAPGAMPYPQQAPMGAEGYPNGTFNLTSGEIARPAPARGSRKGLLLGLVAVVLGVSAFGGVLWFATQRRTDDVVATARPPATPAALPLHTDAAAQPPLALDDASAAQAEIDVPAAPLAVDASVTGVVDASVTIVADAGARVVDAGVAAAAIDAGVAVAVADASASDAGVAAVAAPVVAHDAGVRVRPRGPRPPRPPRRGNAPIF
jgi:hypothetical protein